MGKRAKQSIWTGKPTGVLRCVLRRRLRRRLRHDEEASMTLEWAMLLAVIGLPSYAIINLALEALVGHYQMMTMVNSLPFP